jgi:hypothetical protein
MEMSKQITMSMWTSIIPDKMYDKWVKNEWIPKGSNDFIPVEDDHNPKWQYVLDKGGKRGSACSKSEKRRLNAQGWKDVYTRYCVPDDIYEKMLKDVRKWYNKVFDYIEKWLIEENFVKIKKGSFRGGFCVEENPERDVVKEWGAPLADKGNKLIQLKEKFGRFTAYFGNLEEGDREKIGEFEQHCRNKFDCECWFS